MSVENDWERRFSTAATIFYSEQAALQGWLPSRRWFSGRKARTIKSVTIVGDIVPVPAEKEKFFFGFSPGGFYVQTEPETDILPQTCAWEGDADAICRDWPPLVIARMTLGQTI